jgi:hypothetical protein
LREEHRLRVLENWVLRGIFGCMRDEIPGVWRKLHNEKLNDLYCSPTIVQVIKSRRIRLAGHVARMGERRGTYRVLVGKPEGKIPLGRPRRRWEDNINPFQSNFSATCMLPSSYLFWAGKRLVGSFSLSYTFKREKQKQNEYNLRYLLAKVCTT